MPILKIRESVEIELEHFGSADRELVLLIPGAGAPMHFWPHAFCRSLAGSVRHVVRYCHRDTGASTHFEHPYAIEELECDLEALLQVLGNSPAHLVGHSMGGYLAQIAACSLPKQVLTATAISAGPTVTPHLAANLGMTGPGDEVWEELLKNQPTGVLGDDLDGWLAVWRYLNGNRPFDEEMAIEYTRELYSGDPRNWQVAENHIHAMGTVPEPLVSELEKLSRPLLVLHGSEDPLVPPDNGLASAQLVPQSTAHILKGAGHMFFNPETWEEILTVLLAHFGNRA